MLNQDEFIKIRKEFAEFEENREHVITLSREIISLSKQIIYAVQRDDLKAASQLLPGIEKKKKVLLGLSQNVDANINKTALQEYAEALCFYHFVKSGKIPGAKELKLDSESYLLGLCDLTGELVRKAVNAVIRKQYSQAFKIKEFVDELYGQFLQFNLRNGDLRQKSDQIKWSLKKLEEVVYELQLKGLLK